MRFQCLLLRMAAMLVPRQSREDWLAEWCAELWYVRQGSALQATAFCLGAFKDALWLKRNHRCGLNARSIIRLESPAWCLLILTVLATAAGCFAFRHPQPLQRSPLLAHLMMLAFAFLLLPVTTSIALGDYPVTPYAPPWATRVRRWLFLAAKLPLLIVIVFCGISDLAWLIGTPVEAHATLVGYVFAFRWALQDQRRRCPVCLCSLTSPTRIGRRSATFLEWYGTELVCRKGHGLLHVPAVATSYDRQRWLYLDPSWRSLF